MGLAIGLSLGGYMAFSARATRGVLAVGAGVVDGLRWTESPRTR